MTTMDEKETNKAIPSKSRVTQDLEKLMSRGEAHWLGDVQSGVSKPVDANVKAEVSLFEQIGFVPQEPGCYLWKDAANEVLYVGKAKNLRARMKQYILGQDEREKIPLMMSQVTGFEYLVVRSEYESLVLEKNLIQHFHPPYNVDYRDDKSYPFIAVTASDVYPAVKFTREKHKPGTHYFGPYTDSRAARETIDILRRVIPICSGTCSEWKRITRKLEKAPEDSALIEMLASIEGRPCFDYTVGKAPGVCAGEISPADYRENVARVESFLAGRRSEIADDIHHRMHEAAAELDFERAARERDKLATIERLNHDQQMMFPTPVNLDLVAAYREETIAGIHVFVVREGRVIIGNEFVLDKGFDVPGTELIETFLKRYYDTTSDIPNEVLVPFDLPDAALLGEWLSQKRGRKVVVRVPKRGDKKKLLEIAETNAKHTLLRFKVKTRYEDDRRNLALLQLESALALPKPPMRIECFDISTIHGRYNVASMVVFTQGAPDKSQYRRFRVRLKTEEANDFAMMAEVLGRRYAPERMADEKFGSRPDLLIVDGGKPQLSAALSQLSELGLDIPVAGLAKADEELWVPWSADKPVVLPSGSASLYLVKQVRDEAHRFAITFHRELRGKGMTRSILDGIPGLGPKRKKALFKSFGGIKNLIQADAERIAQVPGIPLDVAQEVRIVLDQWEEEQGQLDKEVEEKTRDARP